MAASKKERDYQSQVQQISHSRSHTSDVKHCSPHDFYSLFIYCNIADAIDTYFVIELTPKGECPLDVRIPNPRVL